MTLISLRKYRAGFGFPLEDTVPVVASIAPASIIAAMLLDGSITNIKVTSIDAAKITTGYLSVDRLEAGTITATKIDMNDLVAYDFGGGKYLQSILSTQISAGLLKLTSSTVKDGEWYDESGVEINATTGINIYGTANALTTRATKTGTIQCYVGADGKIYAGAGTVALDASGVTITGQKLILKDTGDTYSAFIYATTAGHLALLPHSTSHYVIPLGPLVPTANQAGYVGIAGLVWGEIRGYKAYASNRLIVPVGANMYD